MQELRSNGQEVPEELAESAQKFQDGVVSGMRALLQDPGSVIESIGQNVSDTVDQKGISYAAGYVAPEIAAIPITKK